MWIRWIRIQIRIRIRNTATVIIFIARPLAGWAEKMAWRWATTPPTRGTSPQMRGTWRMTSWRSWMRTRQTTWSWSSSWSSLPRRFVEFYQYCGSVPPVLRIRDVYPGSWFLPIPDPGSRIPDPKTSTKGRVEKKCLSNIFCSHKFHKIVNYFIFEMLKKKFWANFQRIL